MVDCKNRKVKVGDKVRIEEDIPSVDGMLYKNSIVKIDSSEKSRFRVVDSLGKIYWVESHQISSSYL
tara:strand:- start:340 stop:540 length:201 start_codon:yes stop_codon:yes gene_type:complete